jgi:hypothetical protein
MITVTKNGVFVEIQSFFSSFRDKKIEFLRTAGICIVVFHYHYPTLQQQQRFLFTHRNSQLFGQGRATSRGLSPVLATAECLTV